MNITSTPVARSIPFDNTRGDGYSSTDVQLALEELRDHTVYNSTSTASTASGTLTLTSASTNYQFITGSASSYTVRLPDATTIPLSSHYQITNTSSNAIAVADSTGVVLYNVSANSVSFATLQLNGTAAGTWVYWQNEIVVASGILNYNIISSTAFNTTSATDVIVTSFTVTPMAGTYAIWINSTCVGTNNNALCTMAVFKGGTLIADSKRTFQTGSSNVTFQLGTQTVTQVNGSQTIEGYVSTSTGTLTVNSRSLLLIRLGT